jgi:hypothetical protein
MECPSCRVPTPDTQPFSARCGANLQAAHESGDAATRPAPHPPDALESGTTFAGRYQIIEELGCGGMGRVYKVISQEVHARIALKLIRPEIACDQPAIDRFRHELLPPGPDCRAAGRQRPGEGTVPEVPRTLEGRRPRPSRGRRRAETDCRVNGGRRALAAARAEADVVNDTVVFVFNGFDELRRVVPRSTQ